MAKGQSIRKVMVGGDVLLENIGVGGVTELD